MYSCCFTKPLDPAQSIMKFVPFSSLNLGSECGYCFFKWCSTLFVFSKNKYVPTAQTLYRLQQIFKRSHWPGVFNAELSQFRAPSLGFKRVRYRNKNKIRPFSALHNGPLSVVFRPRRWKCIHFSFTCFPADRLWHISGGHGQRGLHRGKRRICQSRIRHSGRSQYRTRRRYVLCYCYYYYYFLLLLITPQGHVQRKTLKVNFTVQNVIMTKLITRYQMV